MDWTATFAGALPKCLSLNPATGRVMVLTDDRTLHALDPDTGRATPAGRVPDAPPMRVDAQQGFHQLAFAPDGRRYLVSEGDQLLVVETATGKLLHAAKAVGATACWLTSERLIFGLHTHYGLAKRGPDTWEEAAWIFDLAALTTTPLPPQEFTGPFALSEDGEHLALVKHMQEVQVFRVAAGFDGEPEFRMKLDGNVKSVAFTADGRHLAAAGQRSDSAGISVLDLASGKIVLSQAWPSKAALALCPDEPLLVLAGRDSWMVTWKFLQPYPRESGFDDGEPHGNPYHPGGPFNPPLRLLTRSAQNGRTGFLFGHEAAPRDPIFLPGKKAFVTASDDGTVRRWPLASRVPARQRRDSVDTLFQWHHPTASHDGNQMLYRRKNGEGSRLWDRTKNLRTKFPGDEAGLAAFNDGRALLRRSETGEVICYQPDATADLEPSRPVELWRAPGGPGIQGFHQIIHSVVSRDERRVAVLQPGKLLVVDMDTHATRDTPDQGMLHGSFPGQWLDLSPDGKTIAVTGFNGRRVRLFSADDLAIPSQKLIPENEPTSHDSACAFSRDGARLFVGNEDGLVRVFDVATREEIPAERWKAHSTEVTALTVSQSGEIVATAGGGIIALWSAEKDPAKPRRERLKLVTGTVSRNWMHFGGGDTVLLHCAPNYPIEAWEAR